jgi:hypothetical protein
MRLTILPCRPSNRFPTIRPCFPLNVAISLVLNYNAIHADRSIKWENANSVSLIALVKLRNVEAGVVN